MVKDYGTRRMEFREVEHLTAESKPDKLEPCPFCGNVPTQFTTHVSGINVHCKWCGARGPECSRFVTAMEQWNNRAESCQEDG